MVYPNANGVASRANSAASPTLLSVRVEQRSNDGGKAGASLRVGLTRPLPSLTHPLTIVCVCPSQFCCFSRKQFGRDHP